VRVCEASYARKGDFLAKFGREGCQAVVLKGGTGIGKSVAIPQVRTLHTMHAYRHWRFSRVQE
jgi:hypothetical protein